jgi:hypothetical protein|tara:strand:- start:15954 stop:16268 length:315 start_codon:yes stop_codon:yes gene_type:complete
MPIEKGQRLNPNGRPKGKKNKKTEQWDAIGDFLTQEGSERMLKYLSTTDPDKYADTYLKILEYFKPKLARTESKVSGVVNVIPILNALPADNSNGESNENDKKA